MKRPNLLVYCRVSSAQQENEDTIERQYENPKKFFSSRKMLAQDGGEYEFLPRYPGGKFEPKNFFADEAFNLETWNPTTAFADMMARVERGEVQAIFVSEENRLFRARDMVMRARTISTLAKFKVKIFTMSGEVPQGILLEILASLGAKDKQDMLTKCHDGKRNKIKEGHPPSGHSCYGLNWDNRSNKWSAVNGEANNEAQVIKWVVKACHGKILDDMPFHLKSSVASSPDGLSDRLIAEALKNDGVTIQEFHKRLRMEHLSDKNPGGVISTTFIRNLFRDDRYTGKYPVYLRKTDQVGITEFEDLKREDKELYLEPVSKTPQ